VSNIYHTEKPWLMAVLRVRMIRDLLLPQWKIFGIITPEGTHENVMTDLAPCEIIAPPPEGRSSSSGGGSSA
jgi:hypothetical protein